jgi:RNA polymerase sigma factor (TIGR02999 family)
MELTELLRRVHAGEREALDQVIPLVYGELKKLASAHLRRESRVQPLQTTALVHEAFLRLIGAQHPTYANRAHFYGIASRLMRQILVDAARARSAEKRAAAPGVALAEFPDRRFQTDGAFLALNEALDRLSTTEPLTARLIEMRYFGGMTAEESAEALSLSVHVVRRELRAGLAWLRKETAAWQNARA